MTDVDFRVKAYNVCKDYIGGIWGSISPQDIIMEKLPGGYVNIIFKLSLPDNVKSTAEEPTTVIMRNIIGAIGNSHLDIMTENIIVALLAEKKLTPKIYGIFDGGRLDEYIPSRGLLSSDFRNPNILNEVVKKLACVHALNPPVKKDPDFLFKLWDRQIEEGLKDVKNQIKNIPKRKEAWDIFLSLNPREEWKWLLKLKDLSNSRIVFGHNDFYTNNILLYDEPSEDLIEIIDFEMAGYTYRGFDLASLFLSFCLDPIKEPPYFDIKLTNFPDLDQRKLMGEIYLREFQKASGLELDFDYEMEQFLEEFKIFLLLFNFMWTVFCLFTPHRSKEPLDWMTEGIEVIHTYLALKRKFFPNDCKDI